MQIQVTIDDDMFIDRLKGFDCDEIALNKSSIDCDSAVSCGFS
jgi:hypothetical protein